MKKRSLLILFVVLVVAAMMSVIAHASEPLDNDLYVNKIKEDLLDGISVTLEQDIEVDGSDLVSIHHITNGNGNYLSPGIFNVIGESVVFDLNGHTITYHGHEDFLVDAKYMPAHGQYECSCDYAHAIFFANGGGTIAITDSVGTGRVEVDGKASAVYAASPDSVITVDGGTWMSNPCETCKTTGFFLYASHGGELYIEGGVFGQTYTAEQGESNLILHHGGDYANKVIDFAKTRVEFSGGRYIGMNPKSALLYEQNRSKPNEWSTTNVVADGFTVFANGDGSYSVGKSCSMSIKVLPADAEVTVTNYCGKAMMPEADGTYTLAAGESYTCTAVLDGYDTKSIEFVASDADELAFTLSPSKPERAMPSFMLVLVKYWLSEHIITASAGEGGTITPEGETAVRYSCRNALTYTITPDEGYVIADVRIDGESVGAAESCSFIRVKKDHTIEAVFEKID